MTTEYLFSPELVLIFLLFVLLIAAFIYFESLQLVKRRLIEEYKIAKFFDKLHNLKPFDWKEFEKFYDKKILPKSLSIYAIHIISIILMLFIYIALSTIFELNTLSHFLFFIFFVLSFFYLFYLSVFKEYRN